MKNSSNKSDLTKKIGIAIISTAVMATLAVGGTAFADTSVSATATTGHPAWAPGSNGGARRAPGVFGTVSAVSGDTITVASKGFGSNATATTYSVDATGATVTKAGAASSVSGIAVGDTVMAQGTVSGTTVTATKIEDGMMMKGGVGGRGDMASSTMMHAGAGITGNGEPVIGGAITAVSGSTLTVTNKSNVTYTIDATAATVLKGNATSSVSAVAVGDDVVVQGTVNGNAVVASSVIDQGAPKTASSTGTQPKGMGGILGGIGAFIHSLFGFF